MKFGEGIKKLKEYNEGYIIMAKSGIFYVAIGNDAIVLQKEFELRPICFGKNICKCVVNIEKIKIFTKRLDDKKYKYIVYDYIKGEELALEEQFVERYRQDEGMNIEKTKYKVDCKNCWYNKRKEKRNKINNEMEKDEIKIINKAKHTLEKRIKFVSNSLNNYLDNLIDEYLSIPDEVEKIYEVKDISNIIEIGEKDND